MLVRSAILPVIHGFSTREGGVSEGPFASLNVGRSVGDDPEHVAENARRLAAAAGLRAGQLVSANQVHGDRILEVDRGGDGDVVPPAVGDADGLVTRTRGVAIGIRTADCVPVLIYAPDVGAAAVVHAGWRGAVAAIARKGVEELVRRWGAAPSQILAAVGPSIRKCCYTVGEDVARSFEARFGAGVACREPGTLRLDIAEANRRALREAGVPEENIDVLPQCTACDARLFFSHRRDQGKSGRHLSFICLP